MRFNAEIVNLNNYKCDCIVVAVFKEIQMLSYMGNMLDKITNGYISNLLKYDDSYCDLGRTTVLYFIPGISSIKRVLLLGCGKKKEIDEYRYKNTIISLIKEIKRISCRDVTFLFSDIYIEEKGLYWNIRRAIENINDYIYSFSKFSNKNNDDKLFILKVITFNVLSDDDLIHANEAIDHGMIISSGVKSAKDLGNSPANFCNPFYLVSKTIKLVNRYKNIVDNISVKVINKDEMKEIGMDACVSVSSGSSNESFISIIKYNGDMKYKSKPIIFVGKGLTFDSGGISLKPAYCMDEMKYDMCGAAVVYGIIKIILKLLLPINFIGVLVCCENMIGSRSLRPGDIIRTLSKKTVEVLNTDAEGRLVLCDILTYVKRYDPEVVVDIATLTGACAVALGSHFTGLFSNDQLLADEMILASRFSGDLVWQLPLNDFYKEDLNSNFADIANIGGKYGGAITAAYFLSQFVDNYKWVHLDIAGTAWKTGINKCSTGRPIYMLSQFLLSRSKKNCC